MGTFYGCRPGGRGPTFVYSQTAASFENSCLREVKLCLLIRGRSSSGVGPSSRKSGLVAHRLLTPQRFGDATLNVFLEHAVYPYSTNQLNQRIHALGHLSSGINLLLWHDDDRIYRCNIGHYCLLYLGAYAEDDIQNPQVCEKNGPQLWALSACRYDVSAILLQKVHPVHYT